MHANSFKALDEFKTKWPDFFRNKNVLEIGSWESPQIRQYFENCNYIGIDLMPNPNVDIVINARDTVFESNQFDVIVCLNTFEHDNDWFGSLSHNLQWLKKGGMLFLGWGTDKNPKHEFGPFKWNRLTADEFLVKIKEIPIEILDEFYEDKRYGPGEPGIYDVVARKI